MIRVLSALLLSILLITGSIIITLPLLVLIIYRDIVSLWLKRKDNNVKRKYIVIFYVIILSSLAVSNLYVYSKSFIDPHHYKNIELNKIIKNINENIRATHITLLCHDDCGVKKTDISWNKKTSINDIVSLICHTYDVEVVKLIEPIGYTLGGHRAMIFAFSNKGKTLGDKGRLSQPVRSNNSPNKK